MRSSVRRAVARLTAAAAVAATLVPLAAAPAAAEATPFVPGTVAPVAGHGAGDGNLATEASIDPNALAYAPDGDLLVPEAARLRRIDSVTKVITTIAGTGIRGPVAGDGGQATQATFDRMSDVVVAPDGVIYVADSNQGRVRRIGTDGVVTTLFTISYPNSLALSPGGTLYVANDVVYRWTGGALERVAGGGGSTAKTLADARSLNLSHVHGMAFTKAGHLLLADGDWYVRRVAGGAPGGATTVVADTTELRETVFDVAVRASDDMLAVATHSSVLRVTNPGGTPGAAVEVDQGTARCGNVVAWSPGGTPVTGCWPVGPGEWFASVRALPGNGTLTILAGTRFARDGLAAAQTWFEDVHDVASGADGTVWLTESGRLRAISPGGVLRTVAGTVSDAPSSGDGGPASAAVFASLDQVEPAPDGSVYVSDGARVRRVVEGGDVTAVAGGTGTYVEGGPAAGAALAGGRVVGMALDASGRLFLATLCATYRVDLDGTIHSVPGPPCDKSSQLDVDVDAQGRPIVVRNGAGSITSLFRTETDGTVREIDRHSFFASVAVTPDGTIETAYASLRPDGSRDKQSYSYWFYEPMYARLAAEASGTLLSTAYAGRIFRLTPVRQTLPPAVTGLSVTPGPGSLTLTWDAVPSEERRGFAVVIVRGTTPTASRVGEGETVTVPADATSVTVRRAAFVDGYPGLRTEPYSVSIFAYGLGGASPPASATATPLSDTTAPETGSGLVLSVADGVLSASWPKPTEPDFFQSHARLSSSGPVASPAQGIHPVHSGVFVASWEIAGLTQGTYTVSVFHEDLLGNRSAPLTGTVFVDKTPPPKVTGLVVTSVAGGTRIRATWNAASPDAKTVTPRLRTGYDYPSAPDDGRAVAPVTSTATSAEWVVKYFGAQHRVAVFTTDVAGNSAAATYLYIPRRPARIAIATTTSVVTAGQLAEVRGYLGSPGGSPYASQRMELWARPRRGTEPFRFVSATSTDYRGRVSFRHAPRADIVYQLRHPASTVAAVASETRTVYVTPAT